MSRGVGSPGGVSLPPAAPTLRDFYERSGLAPYLNETSGDQNSTPDGRSDADLLTNDIAVNEAGEADAAAGSVLKRVSSLGLLRPSPVVPRATRPPVMMTTAKPLAIDLGIHPTWRLKERMRTAGIGLIMALNIGTDPPDVIKPHPCAKLQCWMDPDSISRAKARDMIGERLEAQYARWQQQRNPKPLKYRRALDPTVEDVRALCLWLRRQAKTEHVLLHYNGHGVPRPTVRGEIWVFDKNHTQYIPLHVPELRQWMGKPSIVILDCSGAGVLMPFLTAPFAANDPSPTSSPSPTSAPGGPEFDGTMAHDTIVLCPTTEHEWLPLHPDYPADVFTACLTTPMEMALRWFVRRNPQSMGGLKPEAVDSIPGKFNDRKTPLGELHWIFAAVTDCIAWNILPKPLFQRLFRQDHLVAGIFRNFLLADRILRSLNCTPQSYPPLPPGMCDHPLWEAWDLACETCLCGLMRDGLLSNDVLAISGDAIAIRNQEALSPEPPISAKTPAEQPPKTGSESSISSPFFSEQLTAFEIWLEFATMHKASPGQLDSLDAFEPPEQLPIVLQVLLSPAHRVRALMLFRRFLELGPWAVNSALRLGILPYVMKLLQSPEYKQNLIAIWVKILSFDPSCQMELVRDGVLPHFIGHLTWGMNRGAVNMTANAKESTQQRSMAAFILAATCLRHPKGQTECIRHNLHVTCNALLSSLEISGSLDSDPDYDTKVAIAESRVPSQFRMWLCIALGNLVQDNRSVQNDAISAGVHRRLFARTSDKCPDVRASACYALGCLVGSNSEEPPVRHDTNPDGTAQGMGENIHQPSVTFSASGTQFQQGLLPNRVLGIGNQVQTTRAPNGNAANNVSGRLQPSFAPVGPAGGQHLQWHPQQTSMGQPGTMQPLVYNPSVQVHPNMVVPGLGILPTPTGFGGRLQMGNSFLGQGQPSLGSSTSSQTPSENRQQEPSVFEDVHRVDLDLTVADVLLKATYDASPIVRYEAIMSLACAVGKYLPAFLAVAEESVSSDQSPTNAKDGQSVTGRPMDDEATQNSQRPTQFSERKRIPLPEGVHSELAAKFLSIWKVFRLLQHHDPHPAVSAAANAVVSVVHENILRIKMELAKVQEEGEEILGSPGRPNARRKSEVFSSSQGGLLSGKRDEMSSASSHEPRSPWQGSTSSVSGWPGDGSLSTTDPFERVREQAQVGSNSPLIRPMQQNDEHIPLRRISSEYGDSSRWRLGQNSEGMGQESNSGRAGLNRSATLSQFKMEYNLPKSKFYEWKKAIIGGPEENPIDEVDPLSLEGAAMVYRERRNFGAHEKSRRAEAHFSILAPKAPRTKQQRFDDDFLERDNEENDPAAKAISQKKQELELKEKHLLRNTEAETSLLRFHSYEDALVVCDGHDGISVWDCQKGTRKSEFRNANPKGSRMTSASWINEMSNSKFLVGCDDGSVRIWDGLLKMNGDVSSSNPSLSSAFFAAPDMTAGARGSGMVLEWQQYSGKLIVAGNSKFIRCWDLGSEQCGTVLETASEACVTTLNTAWDYDPYGQMKGSAQGFSGMGPDIIVAGHSDGTIKLFDIRSNRAAQNFGSATTQNRNKIERRGKLPQYTEHGSWIVGTAFTGYGGKYEVVSGSVTGDLKVWDIRHSTSLRTYNVQRSPMTALSVHPKIPVAVTGSHAQFIKVITLDGDILQVMRFHEEMAGHRIGPVSCLQFHPHKPLLAVGGTDAIVSVYSPKHSTSWV